MPSLVYFSKSNNLTTMKKLVSITFLLLSIPTFSQNHSLAFNLGARTYFSEYTTLEPGLNVGLQYSYQFLPKYAIVLNAEVAKNRYKDQNKDFLASRRYVATSLKLRREIVEVNRFSLLLDLGLTHRYVGDGVIGVFPQASESIGDYYRYNMLGGVVGLNGEYNLKNNWFLTSSLDFSAFFFQQNTARFQDQFTFGIEPSLLDLNFKLGIGRKFGK